MRTADMPPPMREQDLRQGRDRVDPHDHAVCVYDSPSGIVPHLARFLEEGVERGETCVFVHSSPTEDEAWRLIAAARPGADRLKEDEIVVVNLYRDAFEAGKGRIDHDHVGGVVSELVEDAERKGRAGVRVFVDASRVYFDEGRAKEWFAFESWLGRRLAAKVGLVCGYLRSHATRPDLLPDMLRTHAYRFG